jgi:hypothetical protein
MRAATENYYFTGNTSGLAECTELIKPARFTQKKYQACVAKLRQAGMTNDELTFFSLYQRAERISCSALKLSVSEAAD